MERHKRLKASASDNGDIRAQRCGCSTVSPEYQTDFKSLREKIAEYRIMCSRHRKYRINPKLYPLGYKTNRCNLSRFHREEKTPGTIPENKAKVKNNTEESMEGKKGRIKVEGLGADSLLSQTSKNEKFKHSIGSILMDQVPLVGKSTTIPHRTQTEAGEKVDKLSQIMSHKFQLVPVSMRETSQDEFGCTVLKQGGDIADINQPQHKLISIGMHRWFPQREPIRTALIKDKSYTQPDNEACCRRVLLRGCMKLNTTHTTIKQPNNKKLVNSLAKIVNITKIQRPSTTDH